MGEQVHFLMKSSKTWPAVAKAGDIAHKII
jgi:hypothetical protein